MNKKPVILTIAGSDPSGGAGIQVDIRTAERLNTYPCSVITTLTAQNSQDILGIWPVDTDILSRQLESVLDDFTPDAVKIGLVTSIDAVKAISSYLEKHELENIVVDPIFSTTLDSKQPDSELVKEIIDKIFPLATLITPNIPEKDIIEKVAGHPIEELCDAFLLKGGHSSDGEEIIDSLFYRDFSDLTSTPSTAFPTLNLNHSSLFNQDDLLPAPGELNKKMTRRDFSHKRILSSNTHGSGCVLSTAIACFLAKGIHLEKAVKEAAKFVSNAMKDSLDVSLTKGDYGPMLI